MTYVDLLMLKTLQLAILNYGKIFLCIPSLLVLSGVAHAKPPQAALNAVGMVAYVECLIGKGMAVDKAMQQSFELREDFGIKRESVDVARRSGIHLAVLPYLGADCRIDPLKLQEAHQAINIELSKSSIANDILSVESTQSGRFSDGPYHREALLKPIPETDVWRSLRSDIISGLLSIGVTVEYSNTCTGGLLGYYNPRTAVIVICPNNHHSASEITGTLVHEAVHAVQDCAEGGIGDGLMSDISSALSRHGGPKERQIANEFRSVRNQYLTSSGIDRHITNNYLPLNRELEMEAWAIESVPSGAVGLIDACHILKANGTKLYSR